MINEQIVLWIESNKSIYVKGKLNQYLQQVNGTAQINDIFMQVISRAFTVMQGFIKEEKEVIVENLIAFRVIKSKVKNVCAQKSVSFCLLGRIKDQILIAIKSRDRQKEPNNIEMNQLCKQVGSFLWLQADLVKQILQIYAKAISDLVSSGKDLSLNFGFCLVKLSRNKVKVNFSNKFIQQVNQMQNAKIKKQKQTHLWLQVPSKECAVRQSQRWNKNWQLIKQSNLFNYPSLKQIQNHLNRGYKLQLKYKQRYS